MRIKLEEDKATGGDELVNRELEIWRKLRHRNAAPFLGTSTGFGQFGSVALVSLWMAHGTLQTFIDWYDGDLAIAHRFELLVDIASRLLYRKSVNALSGVACMHCVGGTIESSPRSTSSRSTRGRPS
ncbi:hypothetical protein BDN67DRAFT_969036 [Paxillus ammoniavirescens]|nr:hypothetical protein BDN67DRAFT_969036 [Paxillus ammoniavirescens]